MCFDWLRVRVLLLLLLDSAPSFAQPGAIPYVFDPNLPRTTQGVDPYPTGAPWMGPPFPLPRVPGDKAYFDTIEHGASPGVPCLPYVGQTRGVYKDTTAGMALRLYYPFMDWVNSCDPRLFLWCQGGGGPAVDPPPDQLVHLGECKCFPGMYWDDAGSKCVNGFAQNCTEFVGYDFRKRRDCGDGMECEAGRCVCSRNLANVVYRGTAEKDNNGHFKWFCGIPPTLAPGDPCNEFKATKWVRNPLPGGQPWLKVNTTKTGCGDIPGHLLVNFHCRFPADQTGPNPVWPYGARQGGKCGCSDPDKLRFEPGWGCRQRFGAVCDDTTQMMTYTGKDPLENNLHIVLNATCGKDAFCFKANSTAVALDATCACIPTAGRDDNGFCDDSLDPGDVGRNQLVGNPCHPVDLPCHQGGGQECIEGHCQCRLGFEPQLPELLCKALYGQRCMDVSQCVGGASGGFQCTKVPELSAINSLINPDATYCVCKEDFFELQTSTGRCGGVGVRPAWALQIGLVSIVLGLKMAAHASFTLTTTSTN